MMQGEPERECVDHAAAFWNQKILRWESDRYGNTRSSGLLERVAGHFSSSLEWRLRLGLEWLKPCVQGRRVVELGCGSALLAEALLEAGAASYHGFDIAPRAIEAATVRLRDTRAVLQSGDAVTADLSEADVVFSLGLLDWLTDAHIDQVFERSGKARFLHAFSERRASPAQWMHRLYVHLSYGYRGDGYVPRYLDPQRVLGARPGRVVRDRRLSFGVFVTDLEPA